MFHWVWLRFTEFYWVLIEFYQVWFDFTRFSLVWPGFIRFYLVLLDLTLVRMGLNGFYWVFSWFYLILRGLPWFYWVLLGFTVFDWALPSFIELYEVLSIWTGLHLSFFLEIVLVKRYRVLLDGSVWNARPLDEERNAHGPPPEIRKRKKETKPKRKWRNKNVP